MMDKHIVTDTSHTKQMQNTQTNIADKKLVEIKTLKCKNNNGYKGATCKAVT